MTTLRIYQIDAFASQVFRGNPAAVCPLDAWLPDALLQNIASENNLPETAFFVREGAAFRLRWFTPTQEVAPCGHATLAAAFALFRFLGHEDSIVRFESRSGPLSVRLKGDLLTLDFPRVALEPLLRPPELLLSGLGVEPSTVLRANSDPNYYVMFSSERVVRELRPDLEALARLHPFGTVVSAQGLEYDVVSRYFAPSYGIPEDPVTGSIYCGLAPYWGERLGIAVLRAHQASARGGDLLCEVQGDRVLVSGTAHLYLEGTIHVE
jgi:predicted PhzF superfamily epimerase YddE/YHI9